MRQFSFVFFVMFCMALFLQMPARADDDAKKPLQGVWIAESMESDGQPASPDAVKRMRFTFKGDKLMVTGNFKDDREMECDYKIDPSQSPKHLEFTPKGQKPIQGIYEVKDGVLKICTRHSSSAEGRPAEFATKADSKLVLLVLKKQNE